MHVIRRPRWALPEASATPESVFRQRRALLGAAGLGAVGLAAYGVAQSVGGAPGGGSGGGSGGGQGPVAAGGVSSAFPAEAPFDPAPPRAAGFEDAGRPITPEDVSSTYNNFYEFASHKRIFEAAQALDTSEWTVTVDGLVDRPTTFATDDLLRQIPLEDRVVRHRCVEAWAMVVPWVGFKLSEILDRVGPQGSAKYLRFESFNDPDVAAGQRAFWYPWPYIEGLTIEEAANPLSFMVVGAYGKVLHKQFGAPIRLHTPWKYGFKHIKSITRITLTEERPVSFWEELQGAEYGFWANVNPDVDHPRWSQATERMLGSDERVPTLLYNGYGEEVAGLYTGMEDLGDALWR